MADTSVGYKCPNCSAPLTYQPHQDKVTCEYCGTELKIKALEELFAKQEERAAKAQAAKESKWDTKNAGSEWSEEEAACLKTFAVHPAVRSWYVMKTRWRQNVAIAVIQPCCQPVLPIH